MDEKSSISILGWRILGGIRFGRRWIGRRCNDDNRNNKRQREDGKEKLKKAFPKISGYHAVLDSGTHILAYYDAAIPITLDGNDIKKLQINLKIKSWEVDE